MLWFLCYFLFRLGSRKKVVRLDFSYRISFFLLSFQPFITLPTTFLKRFGKDAEQFHICMAIIILEINLSPECA